MASDNFLLCSAASRSLRALVFEDPEGATPDINVWWSRGVKLTKPIPPPPPLPLPPPPPPEEEGEETLLWEEERGLVLEGECREEEDGCKEKDLEGWWWWW